MTGVLTRMGRHIMAALVAGMLVGGVSGWQENAYAQFDASFAANTITTHGVGEVRVKPDSLNVTAMVETTHANLAEAREENSRRMQQMISALRALEIPNMQLETQTVQVYPMTGEQQRDRLPRTVGYRVINGLNVRVTRAGADNLATYGSRIVDTALSQGANNVHGIDFYLSDMDVPRRQALEQAVKQARETAETMARAAGVTISSVYMIEGSPEYGGGYPPPRPMYTRVANTDVAEAAPIPVETGEIMVTARVTVRYKF